MIANPFEWADPAGAVQFYGILAVILFGCGIKLFAGRWSDWLDERSGRGSIRDWWLYSEIERDARRSTR